MKTEYTLNTHNGDSYTGFKLSHQRELPKSAILHSCAYDTQYIMHNIYRSYGKKGVKTFIIKLS